VLNVTGLNVEPRGIPDSMGKDEEDFPKMGTEGNLDDQVT
jgi:hypothetical protein